MLNYVLNVKFFIIHYILGAFHTWRSRTSAWVLAQSGIVLQQQQQQILLKIGNTINPLLSPPSQISSPFSEEES